MSFVGTVTYLLNQSQVSGSWCVCVCVCVCVPLGGRGLVEVPQFECVVGRSAKQQRLRGVKGQTVEGVQVTPESDLVLPGLQQRLSAGGHLGRSH